MPQFDMIVIAETDADAGEIVQHKAGAPLKEGGGDETYRCGACKTKIFVNVRHHDAHGAVVRCGKCRKINTDPMHHHH